ncbi:MAG: helix-turn-helix transcriptional regulator [Pyrinomonadaceae bacterium]
MSDLKKFIEEQKRLDPEFAEGYDEGYENFKIGVLLQMSREQAELTQEEVAQKMGTKKSAISRIENHADNITLSTLRKYAKALGKKVHFEIV